jgi:hypothetical protein
MSKNLLLAAVLLVAALGCSKSTGAREAEATLPELNRALQAWIMAHGSYPSNVNQLTNFPALEGKRMPTPPPGKKLAVDPGTRQLTYVAQ